MERQPRTDFKVLLLPAVTLVCLLFLLLNMAKLQPAGQEARGNKAVAAATPSLDRPAFDRCVQQYFAGLDLPFSVESDTVHVDASDLRGRGIAVAQDVISGDLSVTGLVEACAATPPERWPEIIEQHFAEAFATLNMETDLGSVLYDFASASGRLKVRLLAPSPSAPPPGPGRQPVWREDLPGLRTVLVAELYPAARQVTEELRARWGKDTDQLFGTALTNVRETCRPEVGRLDLDGGESFYTFMGKSPYVAAYALLLEMERLPKCVGVHGAVLAVPTRHTFLCCAVNNARVRDVLPRFAQFARAFFERGPGAITDELFWYHEGQYTRLHTNSDGDVRKPVLPQALTDLLR